MTSTGILTTPDNISEDTPDNTSYDKVLTHSLPAMRPSPWTAEKIYLIILNWENRLSDDTCNPPAFIDSAHVFGEPSDFPIKLPKLGYFVLNFLTVYPPTYLRASSSITELLANLFCS